MNTTPDFSAEQNMLAQGKACIVGVDEVGRGPWAGPVVAAAVWIDPAKIPLGATDSKKLSAKKRDALAEIIWRDAKCSIAECSVEEVDKLNIREATFLAMERAVAGLNLPVDYIYVDGNALPKNLPNTAEAETVVKGDSKILSIACASIVAKVYRDKMMADLAKTHPHYAWERNAGYGTKAHQEGLATHGVTVHHRRSFKPIKMLLEA
ncbi:MAG: ribonuclease HII [Alphaproteobacteria bacterium]|jgi:ribonuclease HII